MSSADIGVKYAIQSDYRFHLEQKIEQKQTVAAVVAEKKYIFTEGNVPQQRALMQNGWHFLKMSSNTGFCIKQAFFHMFCFM